MVGVQYIDMKEVMSTCPNCGTNFTATLQVADDVSTVEHPCSAECNLEMVGE